VDNELRSEHERVAFADRTAAVSGLESTGLESTGLAVTNETLIDVILAAISGIALGLSIFVILFALILFIGSYVYEKKTPWETKAYLMIFVSTCIVLILSAALSLQEIYEPRSLEQIKGMVGSLSRSEYAWSALVLFAFITFCASMSLFLIGPYELAQRILELTPTPKQHIDSPKHLKIQTDIPARLDRLPWGAFHTFVAVALGITWILNGLEVTLAGALSNALWESPILQLSGPIQVGIAHSAYVAGLVIGSLFFGWLTDRLGRKKLFFVTLIIYLLFTALTGASWNFGSLTLFRFLTGTGIGGEYAAINSTIQELIPAKYRGRTDLLISGTFWIGAVIGALGSTVLLNPAIINPEYGWRVAFGIGAVLALIVLRIRRKIPESPRWLMTHDRIEEAEAIVAGIEDKFKGQLDTTQLLPRVQLIGRTSTPLREVIHTVFWVYPGRAFVSFALMAAQALVYNAIFFTNALVLTHFFHIPLSSVGWYLLPFAIGNFLGPLFLGPLFDNIGRKRMISGTYLISGIFLAISAYLFIIGYPAAILSFAWMITFFVASAAASAAYLTAGELFPLEIRALAIAFFFAIGTGIGGVAAPWLFSALAAGEAANLFSGYLVLAGIMILAAVIELVWGVAAERKPLETVARPLTFVE
jgi:MFS family permease